MDGNPSIHVKKARIWNLCQFRSQPRKFDLKAALNYEFILLIFIFLIITFIL